MASLIPWLVGLAAILIIGAAVLAPAARRELSGSSRPAILVVSRTLAVAYAAITLVVTVVTVVAVLVSEVVELSVPVAELRPEGYPWVEFDLVASAEVVGGGFRVLEASVTGLGLDARLWLAAGHALDGITFIVIALVIALLCHRMLGGSPFRPLMVKGIMTAATAIAAGGIAWQLCYGIAGTLASQQLFAVTGWSADFPSEEVADYLFTTVPGSGLPEATSYMAIDFWPLMVGLALAALAVVFRHGERLQRDTEGLV